MAPWVIPMCSAIAVWVIPDAMRSVSNFFQSTAPSVITENISILMSKVNSYLIEFPNTLPDMDIGERIRLERRKRKWSQNDLAKAVGVTQGLISQIENGTNDSSKHLTAIARALEVSADWLESGKGDPKRREVNVPMSLHYPPIIAETLAIVPTPDGGTELIFAVFRDINGSQVTIKLTDTAARTLSQKLADLGR